MGIESLLLGGIGTLAGVGGKIAGDVMQANQQAEINEMLQKLSEEMGGIPLPVLKRIYPELVGASEFSGIPQDTAGRERQLGYLKQLENEYATGGMTEGDQAGLTKIQNESARMHGARLGQLQNNLSARGMNNSGMGVMMALQSAQNAGAAQDAASTDYMSQARGRALRALESGMQGNESMMNMDYRQSSDRARAQDAINQANAGMKMNAQLANNQIENQRFQNSMAKQQARAAAVGNQTQNMAAQGNDMRQSIYDLGGFANNLGNTLGASYQRDEDRAYQRERDDKFLEWQRNNRTGFQP